MKETSQISQLRIAYHPRYKTAMFFLRKKNFLLELDLFTHSQSDRTSQLVTLMCFFVMNFFVNTRGLKVQHNYSIHYCVVVSKADTKISYYNEGKRVTKPIEARCGLLEQFFSKAPLTPALCRSGSNIPIGIRCQDNHPGLSRLQWPSPSVVRQDNQTVWQSAVYQRVQIEVINAFCLSYPRGKRPSPTLPKPNKIHGATKLHTCTQSNLGGTKILSHLEPWPMIWSFCGSLFCKKIYL